MEFGKLCSWEKQGNRVVFQFEKRTGRVEILTPEIFNVFSGVVSEEHRSKAIEGDKSVAVDFTAAEADGAVEISTDAVTARITMISRSIFIKRTAPFCAGTTGAAERSAPV